MLNDDTCMTSLFYHRSDIGSRLNIEHENETDNDDICETDDRFRDNSMNTKILFQ